MGPKTECQGETTGTETPSTFDLAITHSTCLTPVSKGMLLPKSSSEQAVIRHWHALAR